MKSILFALIISAGACGSDSASTARDPMSFMPKLSSYERSQAIAKPVAPAEPIKVVAVERVMPTKFDDALAQGRDALAKGDNAGAKELLDAAVKLDKKRAEPHIELARMYITLGDKAHAVAAANKGVKLAPLSSQAWNTKGRAELARFDYDNAIEAFSKSVELNRDNVWAWNNLGYAELQLKKYDEAVAHFTEATTRPGATGFMFNNLGTALEQLDRLDEARTAFDAGGKLGSKEAVASRARLEGVKSIALAKIDTAGKIDTSKIKTFDTGEGKLDEDVKKDETKPEVDDALKGTTIPEVKSEIEGSSDDEDAGTAKSTM